MDANKEAIYKKCISEYMTSNELSIKSLCDKYSVTYSGLYQYMRRRDIPIRRVPKMPLRKADEKLIEDVVNAYAEAGTTASITNIAKKYGISNPTARRWVSSKGVKVKRPKYNVDLAVLKRAEKYYVENGMNIINAARKARLGKNTLQKWLKENGLLRKTFDIDADISYNRGYFDRIDTEEKAYWFGFIMADGCVRLKNKPGEKISPTCLGIEISENDIDMLHKFNKAIGGNVKIKKRKKVSKAGYVSNMCSIYLYSSRIVEALCNKGCVPKKTYKGYIEKDAIKGHALKVAFLRGYIDGDGYVSKNTKAYSMSIVIHNHSVMNYILRVIIKEFDVIPAVRYEADKLGGAYRLRIMRKKDYLNFFKELYKNATIFMERKYKNYLEHSRLETSSQESQDDKDGIKLEGSQT